MFNVSGFLSYSLPRETKNFFIILFLSSIISLVLPSLFPLLLAFQIVLLTIYASANYFEIYVFCQHRKYIDSRGMDMMIFMLSYFLYAIIFVIISFNFVSYIYDLISPFIMAYFFGVQWMYGVSFWISGLSYISFFGYLNKLSRRLEYDLPEEV